jgi:hypothetical protein
MSFFWDVYQTGQIAEAKTDAIEAKAQAAQFAERVRDLEFTTSRLALACQAMWELLRERSAITDQDLLAKMNEVDLRDGTKDGRMTPIVVACPKCGKPSNTKHSRCLYCGADLPRPHVFQ